MRQYRTILLGLLVNWLVVLPGLPAQGIDLDDLPDGVALEEPAQLPEATRRDVRFLREHTRVDSLQSHSTNIFASRVSRGLVVPGNVEQAWASYRTAETQLFLRGRLAGAQVLVEKSTDGVAWESAWRIEQFPDTPELLLDLARAAPYELLRVTVSPLKGGTNALLLRTLTPASRRELSLSAPAAETHPISALGAERALFSDCASQPGTPCEHSTTSLPTPRIISVVGRLAAGRYAYRVAAFGSQGETRACDESTVAVTGATGEVRLAWTPVHLAAGYKVFRRDMGAAWADSLVAVVPPNWTSWVDRGWVLPGFGRTVAMTAAALKIRASSPLLLPATVSFGVRKTGGERPGGGQSIPYLWTGPRADSKDYEPIVPRLESGGRRYAFDATAQILELDGERMINCVTVYLPHGVGMARDFRVDTYDAPSGQWREQLHVVKNRSRIVSIVLPETIARAVRVHLPYGSNELIGLQASFSGLVVAEMSVNGARVDPADPSAWPIELVGGKNTVECQFWNPTSSSRSAEVRLRFAAWDKVGGMPPIRQTVVSIPAGERSKGTLTFSAGGGGWKAMLLETRATDTDRTIQSLKLPARIGRRLDVRLVQPCYRNSIFSKDKLSHVAIRAGIKQDRKALSNQLLRLAIAQRKYEYKTTGMVGSSWGRPLELSIEGLAPGVYQLATTIHGSSVGEQRARRDIPLTIHEPAPYEVRIRTDGTLLCNDQRLFPIGVANATGQEQAFRDLAEWGINVSACRQASAKYLDLAAKYGLKVLIPVPLDPSGSQTEADGTERLRSLVAENRDHRALLGYRLDVGYQTGRGSYELLRKLDPYHPVMATHTEAGGSAGCDIVQVDLDTKATGLGRALYHVDAARQAADIGRAVVASIRLADQSAAAGLVDVWRLRFLLYGAVLHGANGFVLDSYDDLVSSVKADRDIEEAFKRLIRELSFLSRTMTAPPHPVDTLLSPSATPIEVMARRVGDEVYVFAVNPTPLVLRLTISARLPASVAQLNVVGEGREVLCRRGVIEDEFRGYEVHVYTTGAAPKFGLQPLLERALRKQTSFSWER